MTSRLALVASPKAATATLTTRSPRATGDEGLARRARRHVKQQSRRAERHSVRAMVEVELLEAE